MPPCLLVLRPFPPSPSPAIPPPRDVRKLPSSLLFSFHLPLPPCHGELHGGADEAKDDPHDRHPRRLRRGREGIQYPHPRSRRRARGAAIGEGQRSDDDGPRARK